MADLLEWAETTMIWYFLRAATGRVDSRPRELSKKCRKRVPGAALRPASPGAGTLCESEGWPAVFLAKHPPYGPRDAVCEARRVNGISYVWIGAGVVAGIRGGLTLAHCSDFRA